ncbi:hypothetical protein C8Q76DRAFT_189101 [Earliella scabrosa]|nr:hypothetical protein C8Q76DRAFT_189101 [Earliella scabrosa]
MIHSFKFSISTPDQCYQALLAFLARGLESLARLEILAKWKQRPRDTLIDLSRDQLPRLHTLTLDGVQFPWTSSLYTSLRSLTLRSCETSMSIADLRRVLRSSPTLEYLELSRCLPDEVDEHTYPIPITTLPELRCLKLHATLSVTAYLCDTISAPSADSICIERIVRPVDQGTIDPVTELAPIQRLYQSFLRHAKRMTLTLPDDDESIHIAFNTDPEKPHDHHPMLVEVNGGIAPVVSPSTWNAIIDTVHNAHSPLTSLCIFYAQLERIDKEMWRRCFSHFPLLDHLDVGDWDTPAAPNAFDVLLDTLQSSVGSGGACELSCTKLRKLEVNGMLLDEDALVSFLTFRASHGLPLQQLVFKEVYCPKTTDVRALRLRLEALVQVTIKYVAACDCLGLFNTQVDFQCIRSSVSTSVSIASQPPGPLNDYDRYSELHPW